MGEEERNNIAQDTYTKKEFIRELEKEAWSDFVSGRQNNLADIALSIVTVVASLIATILATAPRISPWLVAAVAAIPAACTSLQRIVGFRERSDWYFHHADKLREIFFEVKYAKAVGLEEFARKRAKVEVEMGATWRQRNNLTTKATTDN